MIAIAPIATPTPIPAFAPVDKELEDTAELEELGMSGTPLPSSPGIELTVWTGDPPGGMSGAAEGVKFGRSEDAQVTMTGVN